MNSATLTIGESIHKYRREAEMTLAQLSELSGIHKGTISRIENGEVRRPGFETIRPLAASLGIPFEDIVERYIEIEKRADSLYTILLEAVPTGDSGLISKVAVKFLESPSEDSYCLVHRLYELADAIEDRKIRLLLYTLITNYSRDHGMMPFLAKGLLQSYFIARDDFSRLEATYQDGRHILHYTNFLSDEEKLTFHYKLGVHAYNLMRYEECVELCEYIIHNDPTRSEVKAKTLYLLGFAHEHLGDYEKWGHYLQEYGTYNHPGVEENRKVTTAIVKSRTGDLDPAIAILQELLPQVADINFIIIITRLFEIYLETNNRNAIRELLKYEERLAGIPVTTPITQLHKAYFYRLKQLAFITTDFDIAMESCRKSAQEYAKISRFDEVFECLSIITKELLKNQSLIHGDNIRKIDKLYDELRYYDKEE
ncbi:helix-turn-helix domain-containing protein [Paenibacillus dendritiformis]|uniref:helix-turn-helix domain-containing protein n=1 Tax=Paenibacillus dendritiformis TaxID=130049 RepID=UPI0023EE4F0D|nr:helix-turn-helix transcriptional regulator [Paenibacillus dendritiformis]